jgi:hypothetical protein
VEAFATAACFLTVPYGVAHAAIAHPALDP